MTAKGAKAKSRAREAAARKVARRDRCTVGKGQRRQRKVKAAGETARLVKEVPLVEREEGAAGAGNAKQTGCPGGGSGQGRERNGGPPPLPVPIATFTI
jgi:hypothetical protein